MWKEFDLDIKIHKLYFEKHDQVETYLYRWCH